MPTFTQREAAKGSLGCFGEQEISVASPERWASSDGCYATGWTYGQLNFVPGEEIEDAFESGALKASDILLTDAVPAEVPHVAGIVSMAPSTPNSHVRPSRPDLSHPLWLRKKPGGGAQSSGRS